MATRDCDAVWPFRLTVMGLFDATPLTVGVMVNWPLSWAPSVNAILAVVGDFSVAVLARVRLAMLSVVVPCAVSPTVSVPLL